ncbi:MAG: proton-conducting transporter membrane subunit [Spirochaetia bacterium]|nr:proton-conducting transporter membrane subunit [Spirochaetia bacterium]
MDAAPTDIYVLFLLLAPLSAVLITLLGKLLPRKVSQVPAFLIWFFGGLWALLRTADAAGSAPRMYAFGGWREPLGIVFELNGIGWAAAVLALVIFTAVWLVSWKQRGYGSSFYFTLYLTHFSLLGILFSRDLFNLFVWFEVLSLCSIILVAYDRTPTALLAAFRYLLLSTVSITFFLIGVWIFYRSTGSLAFGEIAAYLKALPRGAGAVSKTALALITVGIATRSAVVPFHTWLPPAHSSAPYPVSTLLSGLVIKVPLLALWHFYAYLPFSPVEQLPTWLGIGGALVGGIAAVMQRDAKRILAYSSVGQMGFIVAVFSFGGALGKTATLFYILLHALSKALLFLSVGYVSHHAGSRDVYLLRGMQRRFPLTAVWYWIAAFTLMGIPLSGGYYAKLLVSSSLYSHPGAWLLNIAGAATAIALFKLGRIFTGLQADTEAGLGTDLVAEFDAGKKTQAIGAITLGMAIPAAACVAIALFPQHLFRFLSSLSVVGPVIEGSGGTISGLSWYSTSSLLKAALITLSGAAGLFIFQIQGVRKGIQAMSTASSAGVGLNSSLRFLAAGLLLLLLLSQL